VPGSQNGSGHSSGGTGVVDAVAFTSLPTEPPSNFLSSDII
jgi:hypothetical protein